jgi:hypothetical protein
LNSSITAVAAAAAAATSGRLRAASSPSAFERWYIDGPSMSAPSALMCR